jgi:hypothetical protein
MNDPEHPKAPLWGGWMAPPRQIGQVIPNDAWAAAHPTSPIFNTDAYVQSRYDELSAWHLNLHGYFELGTVYTMIAGLLNILAIYDAFGGPLLVASNEDEDEEGEA